MLEYLLQLWPRSLTSQALAVGVVVGVSVYFLTKKRYNLPPGPRGWPIIGNILSFRKGLMFHKLHDWSKHYGPVMKIQLGNTPVVILSKIDVVLEALIKRQSDFAGRVQNHSGKIFTEGGRDIIGGTYGPTWKLHRKVASKAIRQYLTGDSLNRMLTESLAITTKRIKEVTEPFDPYPFLSLLVFNILSGVCFNKTSSGLDDERFVSYIDGLDKVGSEIGSGFLEDTIPIFQLFPTPRFKRFQNTIKHLQNAVHQELLEHKRSFREDHLRDFTDAMLQAQKEAETEEDPELLAQITDIHVRQTILDVFFAGIDTTRNTLQWSLLALALHPDVQKKVHTEVDDVIDQGLTMNVKDRDRLPYTEAVLHEVMRLRPVAPMGVPHLTMVDTTVGGYELPKGTMVMINHYALHFDDNKWEDVDAFRPERYLGPDGKMASKPESWLPFSAGRRVCLGETVAKPELHLLLAGICRAFTIELAPGTEHNFEPKTIGLVNGPGRYKIVVKSRV